MSTERIVFLGPSARVTLTIPDTIVERLFAHLFRGDGDEHGAIIFAGIARTEAGLRLLAKDVTLARDGVDYVPGRHGYRMLTGQFVTTQILRAEREHLVYLAVHNHGGADEVGFSTDDLESQSRGYPALLDITRGHPVGALVFAKNAMAGRLWLAADRVVDITEARIVGMSWRHLRPSPAPRPPARQQAYDRQARLFGDRGQDLLGRLKVGVIGAGGVGTLLVEYLARLGVGSLVVIDPERVDPTNLPRMPGATRRDAMTWLRRDGSPRWMRWLGERLAAPKVKVMRRLAMRANPEISIQALQEDFVDSATARRVLDCDYLFLAADSMQARLVFNAIVHAYLIPGTQIGVKVPVAPDTGEVGEVFTASRPILPTSGCLWCNGLISPTRLQQEAETPAERRAQRYIDEPEIPAPSVITLNAAAASSALNDFLFAVTGLADPTVSADYIRGLPRARKQILERPRRDAACPHCGSEASSLLAQGDKAQLGTRDSPLAINRPEC